jgi:Predicted aminomethyltransferase related to GcvT
MPLFDLSKRLKLRMTGGDRVRFLNGQVTNDVRKANASLSMPACVLNAKGKIDALIFINGGEEELSIDADDDQRHTLAQRLERYVIADDVTIEDVTEKFALFHVTGETAPTQPNETNWRRAKRFGSIGWDLVVGAGNTIAFCGCSQRRIRFVMRNAPSGGGLSMGFRAGATS